MSLMDELKKLVSVAEVEEAQNAEQVVEEPKAEETVVQQPSDLANEVKELREMISALTAQKKEEEVVVKEQKRISDEDKALVDQLKVLISKGDLSVKDNVIAPKSNNSQKSDIINTGFNSERPKTLSELFSEK